ncbi:hypothetical protein CPB83DRAFT_841039 [Crepidotus variabilis]|uniref:Uncharacterized protein n=1 Tax=Crepidotus variabilis TaxID=179855 RepID=A0A9P6E3B8_9AGAR|nr:hypothetical protein CPB83DRAFT_841039 [Crepidotus variabilis]
MAPSTEEQGKGFDYHSWSVQIRSYDDGGKPGVPGIIPGFVITNGAGCLEGDGVYDRLVRLVLLLGLRESYRGRLRLRGGRPFPPCLVVLLCERRVLLLRVPDGLANLSMTFTTMVPVVCGMGIGIGGLSDPVLDRRVFKVGRERNGDGGRRGGVGGEDQEQDELASS